MDASNLEYTLPKKITRRLIPVLIAAYVMAHLDRINVSFAALTMNQELRFSASEYGLGASLFFLGYLLFEIPSNLLLQRFGARRLITVIMVVWGLISASLALINTVTSFYILRFILGIAESGLYPGVMLYITYWYAPRHRAGAIALFGLAIVIGGLIGGPASGIILDSMDGLAGLSGWRWLFIIEGLPTVLLALWVWWGLEDRPQQARWLTSEEKTWLEDNLPPADISHPTLRQSLGQLREGRIWLLGLLYMLFVGALSGVLLWAPKILQFRLPDLSNADIGWIIGLAYLPFAVGMVGWGRRSDRHEERFDHVMLALALAAVSILILVNASSFTLIVGSLFLIMAGTGGVLSTVWGLITEVLGHRLAAVGIALVNSAGALGSFITVTLLGILRDSTGNYISGLSLLLVSMVLATVSVQIIAHYYRPEGTPKDEKAI
jgi:ACS family tartrate transporter-like MFS transporter